MTQFVSTYSNSYKEIDFFSDIQVQLSIYAYISCYSIRNRYVWRRACNAIETDLICILLIIY